MTLSLESFLDELEKIAAAGVKLTPQEKRRQALQFAALGGASVPVVSGVKNLITHRQISPFAPLKRWLPAQIVGGALVAGAIPAAQHMLAQSNIGKARERIAAEKELRRLAPEGVQQTLQTLPKKDPTLPGGSNAG